MTVRHDLPRETMPRSFADTLLAVAALAAAAVVAGGTFTIWRGYNPTPLSPGSFVEMHQGAVRGLNILLPAVGLAAILTTATLAVRSRHDALRRGLLLAATLFFVSAGLVTRFGNQPINAVVMTWSPGAIPAGWEALRNSWWTYHAIRTAASCAGFLCLAAAVVGQRPPALRGSGAS